MYTTPFGCQRFDSPLKKHRGCTNADWGPNPPSLLPPSTCFRCSALLIVLVVYSSVFFPVTAPTVIISYRHLLVTLSGSKNIHSHPLIDSSDLCRIPYMHAL